VPNSWDSRRVEENRRAGRGTVRFVTFRRSPPVAAAGCALILSACARAADTPAQALAHERWTRCRAPFTELERVEVDGRITFMATGVAARRDVAQCLEDAGHGGPSLPAPHIVSPPGGP
jgi:hypothetical protein